MSPDPAGFIDGSNLYAYVHNNPIKYVDHFGLNTQLNENCKCYSHGHPGFYNAPKDCVCICGRDGSYVIKIGSQLKSAIYGTTPRCNRLCSRFFF